MAVSAVHAAPVPVLDASKLPQEAGWSVITSNAGQAGVATSGTFLTLDTLPGSPAAVQWFYRDVPFNFSSGFSIDFGLQVHGVQQSHNLFDSSVVFYGSTEDPAANFAGAPRQQFIFFDPGLIGWGDEATTFAMDTTDRFHDYRLVVSEAGTAQVFVDGTLALERSDFVKIPRIGFGDITNDPGVNGRFSISYIRVTAPPVPEPSAALLLCVGLAGVGARLRSTSAAR